jgi:hypothetical protein
MARDLLAGIDAQSDFAGQPRDLLDSTSNQTQDRQKLIEAERVRIREQLASEIGPIESALIGVGRGVTKIGRAVGIAKPEDPFITENIKELQKQRPISSAVGEIVGETAPFLIPGLGVSGAAARLGGGAAARFGAAGALGALEGAAIAKGEGGGVTETLLSGGAGGLAAGTLELVLPHIGRIGGRVIRKALGKEPAGAVVDAAGNPSQEFISALDAEGLKFDDIVDEAVTGLSGEVVDPAQASRKAFLESQGLTPTKAQITRGATDFQTQQEAAKSTTRVRDALEEQEAFLTSRFDNKIIGTGGEAVTPTSSVTDVLVSKATLLDSEIGSLYKEARDIAPGQKNVKFDRLTKKLRDLAGSDTAAGGNMSAIIGEMKAKGILDDGLKVVGKVDVQTAEELRKFANTLHNNNNPFGNMKLREIKDSLDDDVFSAAGKDVFDKARSAKAAFEKGLSRAKISKFDSRKQNIVRDILENKIDPNNFADKVVFGKSYRSADLQQLKSYLTDGTGDQGERAFSDLRAEVLESVKEKAFIGPADEVGNKALSKDKLQKALASIGREKINILFNPDEQKFLKDIMKVAELREPVRGTALGRGPSSQAIKKLEDKLTQLPVIGGLFEFSARGALKGKPRRIVKDSRAERIAAPISRTAGQAAAALSATQVQAQLQPQQGE